MSKKYTCPCCGYITLDEICSYDICHICSWEDDWTNRDDPSYKDGPNAPTSLWEAQRNFMDFGACEWCHANSVKKPTDEELDKDWKPYQLSYFTGFDKEYYSQYK